MYSGALLSAVATVTNLAMDICKQIEPIDKWEYLQDKPVIIAGPCSAENRSQVLRTALAIKNTGIVSVFRAGLWKARTRPKDFSGVGKIGFEWLKVVREEIGLPIAVEVATANHVRLALDNNVDIIWIGARTTANPFAVQEIADSLKGSRVPIFVKNPISPDLDLWIGALERFVNAGITRIAAVHRGFAKHQNTEFRNPPHWQIAIDLMRRIPTLPIICDPSHICGSTDGIGEISRRALSLGFNGLMIESHIEPSKALSDPRQQLTPAALQEMLVRLYQSPATPNQPDDGGVTSIRIKIETIEEKIQELLEKRKLLHSMLPDGSNNGFSSMVPPDSLEDSLRQ